LEKTDPPCWPFRPMSGPRAALPLFFDCSLRLSSFSPPPTLCHSRSGLLPRALFFFFSPRDPAPRAPRRLAFSMSPRGSLSEGPRRQPRAPLYRGTGDLVVAFPLRSLAFFFIFSPCPRSVCSLRRLLGHSPIFDYAICGPNALRSVFLFLACVPPGSFRPSPFFPLLRNFETVPNSA